MNVKDLCLGALTFGDASGYDLKKIFETTFSHFCAPGFGSIYPALAELANEGLVCCVDDCHAGRPERKLYHLTAAGRNALVARLEQAEPTHRVKSDFLAVLYFSHLLSADHLETFLEQRIQTLDRQIHLLTTCGGATRSSRSGDQLVCGYGLAVMCAARDYLRQQCHRTADAGKQPAAQTHASHHPGSAHTSDARPA